MVLADGSTFKLIPCSFTVTASVMVQSRNDDIITYLPIARRAWDMECELWSETSKRLTSAMTSLVTVDHVNFNTSQLPKVKAICGRYRWMAWRSQKGIRTKRTILKMHARDKKAREAFARDPAELFDNGTFPDLDWDVESI